MNAAWLTFLGSAGVLAVLMGLLLWDPERVSTTPLVVHCAAGIKAPVEAIAQAYEKAYGVPVHLSFGGSQTLLANIEISRHGDLYLPADDSFLELGRKKGLVAESIPLARMKAVLAVRKGNPKRIADLPDLLREEVRIAQANPDAAAIGRLVREAFEKAGQWEALQRRTAVFKPTVNDIANDVKLGTVDAGFVWDALAAQYPELEIVSLPLLSGVAGHVSVGVLQHSAQPAAALRFARFLAAPEKGFEQWRQHGYDAEAGYVWTPRPELRFFAGAMLRPAIEETITAFEAREGVSVTRIYNGCGILVAQMRTGQQLDAYFACDPVFMTPVSDLFLDGEELSLNQLVILVPKGNPRRIRALRDLGQTGLRVGVGHEKQCALGVLTARTLLTNGVYGAVMRNVTVQSPTGDFLVNQLRTGSLDAVVAYISNANAARDELDAIPIDIPCAIAAQPLAMSRETAYPQLTARLLAALKSEASGDRFRGAGFQWKGPSSRSSPARPPAAAAATGTGLGSAR